MGTRGLTVIKIDGEIKVAQYGQWDHCPDGQGTDILELLRGIIESGELEAFKTKVKALNWLTEDQITKMNEDGEPLIKHPYLSRDCGGKIIQAIHYGVLTVGSNFLGKKDIPVNIIGLQDESAFAEDGLFCEGIFTIDLDAGTYTACGQTFELSALPTEEDFLARFETEEEED